jgi:hypothetical protein
LARFRSAHRRPGFADAVREQIRNMLDNRFQRLEGPQPTVLAEPRRDAVLELLNRPGTIICDAPAPVAGSSHKLRFMPEPKRVLQNYATRAEVSERVSEVWQEVYFKLMNIAAKGRVYCHPDARDTVMAALGPDGVREAVDRVMRELG